MLVNTGTGRDVDHDTGHRDEGWKRPGNQNGLKLIGIVGRKRTRKGWSNQDDSDGVSEQIGEPEASDLRLLRQEDGQPEAPT